VWPIPLKQDIVLVECTCSYAVQSLLFPLSDFLLRLGYLSDSMHFMVVLYEDKPIHLNSAITYAIQRIMQNVYSISSKCPFCIYCWNVKVKTKYL